MPIDDDRTRDGRENGQDLILDRNDRDDVQIDPLELALSGLLDGELEADEAAALRARLARDPDLARRFERLGEMDGQLRRVAATLPDAARLARLRLGLQARIDAAEAAERPAAPVVSIRSRLRGMAPVAAALAAGLALYLMAGPRPDSTSDEASLSARVPSAQGPVRIVPSIEESAEGTSADRTHLAEASADSNADEGLLEAVTDDELAIALRYDLLADLDVIENLELLELLEVLDGPEPL